MLHLIPFLPGWSTPPADWSSSPLTRPLEATIGANGAVAVILARTTKNGQANRVLVVRSDGTMTILQSESPAAESVFRRRFRQRTECLTKGEDCPSFSNVTLARDGTPFVTIQYWFDGAYSGIVEGALVWKGSWHVVPSGNPFDGAGDPWAPGNVSIAAAGTPLNYVFNGDYGDDPGYDTVAPHPPDYYENVTAARYGSHTIQLGVGTAMAMRGSYVAGFAAGWGSGVLRRRLWRPSGTVFKAWRPSIRASEPC
jgi:hypothetical protein